MKRIALFIVATLSLGAAGAGYYFWEREYSPTAKGIKVLRSGLFDPESAQFQDVKHFSTTGATCGLVNAKNRMGGYVGFTRFVVRKDGEVLLDPTDDSKSDDPLQRLDAINKKIVFLQMAAVDCTESASPPASSPK
jgi:hypothetical protein